MKQSVANKRVTGKEQYYTKPDAADLCVSYCLPFVSDDDLFIDPAGGTGEFVEAFKRAGFSNIRSCDIEPKHEEVNLGDFLQTEMPSGVVITNPPFGRANSLSRKFFNKAASDGAKYIGFIVPKSWRKWSVQNSLDENYHLVVDEDMPKDCFYGDNQRDEGVLQTIFQLWERRDYKRDKIEVEDKGYIKKIRPVEKVISGANFSIVTFGHSCGRCEDVVGDVAYKTTTMYLYVEDEEVKRKLRSLDYDRFSTNVAYVKALSIQEINYLLNEAMFS